MRWSILLAVACLAHSLYATPIPSPDARLSVDKSNANAAALSPGEVVASPVATSKEVGTARQSTAENQVDDDDDDDDDEELDLDIEDDDDDDDDDDDEEPAASPNAASPAAAASGGAAQAAPAASSDDDDDDDDDEGDYFERLFDDFLGDDDDDDDDDDEPAKPAAAAAAAASNPAAAAAAAPAAAATPSAGPSPQGLSATDVNDDGIGDYNSNEEASSLEYEQGSDDAAVAAATNVAENAALADEANNAAGADETAAAAAAPVAAAAAATTSDDDDDDDDDDDVGVDDLVEDDDDDDDDDDEDDDDDDDDVETDLDEVVDDDAIEAKRSRAMAATTGGSAGPGGIPSSAYIAKYNRFVDTIMDRVNKILRRSYDPVNVRLQPPQQKNRNPASGTGTNKGEKKKKKTQQRQHSELILPETGEVTATKGPSGNATASVTASVTSARKQRPKKTNKKGSKKPQTRPAHPRAKATLYGLSSIKRSGDVTVNMMSTHTTVKTNFLVGPLTLKVEKENRPYKVLFCDQFGRGAKKELRSATATTAEMSGRLNLRVVHGGAATLHSIKVMQPKQVRMDAAHGVPSSSSQVQVDSADDHDRTREFLWSRSSHIARLVSQKLSSATKSMLRPPSSGSEMKEANDLASLPAPTIQSTAHPSNATTPALTPVVAMAA